MGFWSWITGEPSGNTNSPGDVGAVDFVGEVVESRALPSIVPSPWAGWPAEWATPNWDFGARFNELVDVAWACIDLNASVLAAMPVYRTRGGEIIEPTTWMANPDPSIYSSWDEFAKQLFWDFQIGEAFVLPMASYADGFPSNFRVIPPWLIDVEMRDGVRKYRLGGPGGTDVTSEILHVRYKSTTTDAHGVGPLESAGLRMLTAGVLAKYVRDTVKIGGVTAQTLETDQELTREDAEDLLNLWIETRARNLAYPPVLDNNVTLKTHQVMTPKDMAMLEISQFTESRIAVLLGVPPFLVGLPSGNEMTYSNVSQVFDFHDRRMLRPTASAVMKALSGWSLAGPQHVELNRDEYSRPSFTERADSYVKLTEAGIMSVDEVRTAERLKGDAPVSALTGGDEL